MRYLIGDDEIDPWSVVKAPTGGVHLAGARDVDIRAVSAVLEDFVGGFEPAQILRLKELSDAGIGFGAELASAMFDSDLEPGDAPFEGVLVVAHFRGDEVVLSRATFIQLVDAMVSLESRQNSGKASPRSST